MWARAAWAATAFWLIALTPSVGACELEFRELDIATFGLSGTFGKYRKRTSGRRARFGRRCEGQSAGK